MEAHSTSRAKFRRMLCGSAYVHRVQRVKSGSMGSKLFKQPILNELLYGTLRDY